MISICIPIYNCYAYPLARRLSNQARNLAEEVEIVCIDDHSSAFYERQNKALAEVGTYIRLAENIGRMRVRNLFYKYAKGDYLLFIDSDMQVDDNYLKRYIATLAKEPKVVVGGVRFDKSMNDQEHRLRYLYGSKYEQYTLEYRRKHPYDTFCLSNFMIQRAVFEQMPFNSKQAKYGYETLLFSYRLEQARIPVKHIDNTVVHSSLTANAEYLHRSVEAAENIAHFYSDMWEDQSLCRRLPLVRKYERVRKMGMLKVVYRLYMLLRRPMESHFASGTSISLSQFRLYLLGIFIKTLHYPEVEKAEVEADDGI